MAARISGCFDASFDPMFCRPWKPEVSLAFKKASVPTDEAFRGPFYFDHNLLQGLRLEFPRTYIQRLQIRLASAYGDEALYQRFQDIIIWTTTYVQGFVSNLVDRVVRAKRAVNELQAPDIDRLEIRGCGRCCTRCFKIVGAESSSSPGMA